MTSPIPGLVISDATDTNTLAFDLRDVLVAIAPKGEGLQWYVRDVDALGQGAEKLASTAQARSPLEFESLRDAAQRVNQVIDGQFAGFRGGCLVIAIEAVDSTTYEVYSSDPEILAALRSCFRCVEDAPARSFDWKPT